jgi:hypothetical protein
MHRRGAMMQLEVKISAKNLVNKTCKRTPMYKNEWRINETSVVLIVSAMCEANAKYDRNF